MTKLSIGRSQSVAALKKLWPNQETEHTHETHPRHLHQHLHPTKPYLCWSPCVLDDFAIEPGQHYTSRYRFFVHAGKLDVAVAHRLWSDYSQPVNVVVVADPSASR